MFVKKDSSVTVADVVTRNTGINPGTFLQRNELPVLANAKEAADVILDFIRNQREITIVGDYDADGITATAVMYWAIMTAMQKMSINGAPPQTRIPRRFSEGYGLSEKIIDELLSDSLLITVDNGIAATSAIHKAKEKSITVIVTDHHLPPVDRSGNVILPEADIVVNPHVEPQAEFPNICGATVAYAVALAMFPKIKRIPSLLSLAAIATVTDVMPLIGPNRTLVQDGLHLINRRSSNAPGLNALLEKLKLHQIDEEDLGFYIGPTFNAAGRLYDNGGDKVVALLKSRKSDPRRFFRAETLVETNNERKQEVRKAMVIADAAVAERPIVLYNKSFNEGLIGIIAGQLSEKYNCPAIVFTQSETAPNILKGSGRSSTIHLKNVLDKIQDCILRYGGHAGAAGLSIEKKNLAQFTEQFQKAVGPIEEHVNDDTYYDLELSTDQIPGTIEELKRFAPYGEAHPKPIFHLRCYASGMYRTMGEDGSHFIMKGDLLTIIGFGLAEKYETLGRPKNIECVGYLKENIFRGQTEYVFEIIDFEKTE